MADALPILKALGLNYQPNQLDVPDGSLSIAKNVIIKRDNVIEPRRGLKLYGNSFGTSTSTARQLLEYRDRLLRHFGTTLQYDTEVENSDEQSVFNSFSGSYAEVIEGHRIKGLESTNGNFYFTSSQGVQKISAASASQFTTNSGYIQDAGVPKALDVTTKLNITLGSSSGFLPVDSTVAYRVVWGNRDANNILNLGSPSERSVISSPLNNFLAKDINNVLFNIDQMASEAGTVDWTADYVSDLSVEITDRPNVLRSTLISLADKLDTDILLADGIASAPLQMATNAVVASTDQVNFSSGDPSTFIAIGDILELQGFSPTDINGIYTVATVSSSDITFTSNVPSDSTAVGTINSYNYQNITQPPVTSTIPTHQQLADIQEYLEAMIVRLQVELPGVIPAYLQTSFIDILGITVTSNVDVTFRIPGNITSEDFYQIYRSNITTATGTDILGNLIPDDEMKLVFEGFPTSVQLTNNEITVTDIVPITLSEGATNLYTNEQSGEGITQSNDEPPLALDINEYKEYTFFANTKTKQQLTLTLLGVTNIITDFDNSNNPKILIANETIGNEYTFNKGVQQISTVTVNSSASAINGTYYDIYSANDETPYYVFFNNGISSCSTNATSSDPITVVSNAHKLSDGDVVTIIGSDSTPSIDGTYTVSSVSTNDFEISPNVLVTVGASKGRWHKVIENKTVIRVNSSTGNTFAQNAEAMQDAFLGFAINDFNVSLAGSVATITTTDPGFASNIEDVNTGFTFTTPTVGQGERVTNETTTIDFGSVTDADFTNTGNSDYFRINEEFDRNLYYVWFQNGSSVDPSSANAGRTGVQITLVPSDTATTIAAKVQTALDAITAFNVSVDGTIVTVVNTDPGPTIGTTSNTTPGGVTFTTTLSGALDVLLSTEVSISLAIDTTAKSLIRVINRNTAEPHNAFYTSGASDTPGQMSIQADDLTDSEFYILGTSDNVGTSFNPDISPAKTGITNTVANPTVVTATAHGLSDDDDILIIGSNSTPKLVGLQSISNVTVNTFTVNKNVVGAGTTGSIINKASAVVSTNDQRPNRIYYSKLQQPEAVPTLNFFDVGARNRAILRIFPLRDSLFVFKEDGLYRVSGEQAPFNTSLFDGSTVLIAPDSLGLVNNSIFGWTEQGITSVNESGVSTITRPIDTQILAINSDLYPNFESATWGLGYEQDNSYFVFTTNKTSDSVATIGFRYDTLTNTWTNYDKSNTCGIIKFLDSKLYMGAGDTNFLEVERKDFKRTDYADREFKRNLGEGEYLDGGLTVGIGIGDVSNLKIGDSLVQNQKLTVYTYNQLLVKLNTDTGPADNDYTSLSVNSGADLRSALTDLAEKLDNDVSVSIIKTFSAGNVDDGTDTITITNHGLVNTDPVVFSSTGTLPAGLSTDTTYFVINVTTDTFEVSLTEGSSAVDITDGGSGTHTVQKTLYQTSIINRQNYAISSSSIADPTVITSINHGLLSNRLITISGHSGSSPDINNTYVVTRIDADTFSIPVNVVTPGSGGTFTTQIADFKDIEACYNIIVTLLNASPGVDFSNYKQNTTETIQESTITSINRFTNRVTVDTILPYVQGELVIFSSISTEFQYTPITLGDPIGLKHIREATVMFSNKAFSNAKLEFASDLLPAFKPVPFTGSGKGIFGHQSFGSNFFGGGSHSAPFRTLIPRQAQRCRFLVIKFTHSVAREQYAIYGISLTGRVGISTRAYR